MMVGTFTMPGGLVAVTLSDPPLWENTPGEIVATPLTVVALLMTPTGVVVADTFVTALPEAVVRAALVKNDPDIVVVFTPVRAVPNVGANPVTAVPVCPLTPFTTLVDVVLRLAPVRNDPGVVCTPVTALENVGVTAVTTVAPGCPVTPLMTLAKVYEYSWNDEVIAMKSFASVLQDGVGGVARELDTRTDGLPLVVYNPLS